MLDDPTNPSPGLPAGDPPAPPATTQLAPDDPLAPPPLQPGDPLAPGQPHAPYGARPKSKKRFLPLLLILLLPVVGGIVRAISAAHADPTDLTACAATEAMIETPSQQSIQTALGTWQTAKDSAISTQASAFTSAIQAQQPSEVDSAVNKVIRRCQGISPGFRDQFHQYCGAHPGYCKQTLNLSPF